MVAECIPIYSLQFVQSIKTEDSQNWNENSSELNGRVKNHRQTLAFTLVHHHISTRNNTENVIKLTSAPYSVMTST
jgi:hypothetical protein